MASLARSSIIWTFFNASLCLSLSHAAVSAVLAIAPASLGEQLGSAACGALFVAWVASSFVASCYMRLLGSPRTALLAGLGCNVLYLGGTCAASYLSTDAIRWPLAVGAAVIGGAGNGPLFVGQSCYFSRATKALANEQVDRCADGGVDAIRSVLSSRALLSGLFATTFAISEIGLKLLAGWLDGWQLFAIFTATSATSLVVGLLAMRDANGPALQLGHKGGVCSVAELLCSEPQAVLALVAYNLCFGYAIGYEGTIVLARGVRRGPLGESAVGPASAIVPLVAALAGWPLSFLAACSGGRWGRALVAVGAGSCCYAAVAALVLSEDLSIALADGGGESGGGGGGGSGGSGEWESDSFAGPGLTQSWGGVALLQCLYGLARAAWESVSVALTAEWFGADDRKLSAAFAARLMFDGLGGAAAFFVLPSLPTDAATTALLGLAAASAASVLGAAWLEGWKQAGSSEGQHGSGHGIRSPAASRSPSRLPSKQPSLACSQDVVQAPSPQPSPWAESDLRQALATAEETSAVVDASPRGPSDGPSGHGTTYSQSLQPATPSAASPGTPSALLQRGWSSASLLSRLATQVAWDQGSLVGRGESLIMLPSGLARQSSLDVEHFESSVGFLESGRSRSDVTERRAADGRTQ